MPGFATKKPRPRAGVSFFAYRGGMDANPLRWNFRAQCLLGFAACAALLAFALYTEFQLGLEPCPLCIFQRIAFATLGIVLLLAGLHAPGGARGRRAWGVLALLAVAVGLYVAGRHVWIQHLPADQVPMCGPSLDFLLDAMPVASVVRTVLTGSGECAVVDWTFLGMSMPEWSLLWFVVLGLWVVFAMLLPARNHDGRR
jgi:disulfide bond formation protein DsbB